MWTRKVYISRENKPYCIGFNVDFEGVKSSQKKIYKTGQIDNVKTFEDMVKILY